MITIDIEDNHAGAAAGRTVRVGPLRRWFAAWRKRRVQRITLAELERMNPHLLYDMGIAPQDVIDAMEGRSRSLLFNPVRTGE